MLDLSKYAVNCKTLKEAEDFFEFCNAELNVLWSDGEELSINNTSWNVLGKHTCYDFNQFSYHNTGEIADYYLMMSSINFFTDHKIIFTLKEFKDFLKNYKKDLDSKQNTCYNNNINNTERNKKEMSKMRKNHTSVTEVIDFTYKAVKQPFVENGRIIDKDEIEPLDYSTSKSFMIGEKKEKIIHTENKTICIISHTINGKSKTFKGMAICCRKDAFNKTKGVKIAYLRAKIDALTAELEYLIQE